MKNAYGVLKSRIGIVIIDCDIENKFTIGRSKSCKMILNHQSVSKEHAVIEVDKDKNNDRLRFSCKDMNSSNGTYVNCIRIEDGVKVLNCGDVIRFGSDAIDYVFDINIDSNEENNKTVIYPIKDTKVSLIKSDMYQHSIINHLDFEQDNNKDKIDEDIKEKELEINQLKQQLNTITNLYNSLKESITNPLPSPIEQDKEFAFILQQYNKIASYLSLSLNLNLNPQSQYNPNNESIISSAIDTMISEHKTSKDYTQIISTMQKQFNSEISNFNIILSTYDKKLLDTINSFTNCLNDTSSYTKDKEKAAKYLIGQVDQLINEKEQLVLVNTKQKEQLIALETDCSLYEIDIKSKVKSIDDMKGIISHLEYKAALNERKTGKSIDYNQCLVNALNQIKSKDAEIKKLTKRLNDFKGNQNAGFSGSGYGLSTIGERYDYGDACKSMMNTNSNTNGGNSRIDLLGNYNTLKVEELRKEKEAIVGIHLKL